MNAKKFVLTFLSLLAALYALLYLLYFLVNPEQIYEKSITKKKFFYTKAYSKKQYEQLEKGAYVLVFGTSQIHRISSEMMGKKLLNFHNIYGEPGDILHFLQQLDHKQIRNIEEILYVIDLRAGATRRDKDLINYHRHSFPLRPLSIEKVKRIYIDLKNNLTSSYHAYLQPDGSTVHLDPKAHMRSLPKYWHEEHFVYNDTLAEEILKINRFAKEHHLKITFFTPVLNVEKFKKIPIVEVEPFFKKLLEGGIESIGMYYYIPHISDAINERGEPVSFMDEGHLTQYYVNRWLHQYILTNNVYVVHNAKELDAYIKRMEEIKMKMLNSL